jgi:hypothetical protein
MESKYSVYSIQYTGRDKGQGARDKGQGARGESI